MKEYLLQGQGDFMRYIKAIINRINSLIHMLYVKVMHMRNFHFKGLSILSSSCHFTIYDHGEIILGKHIGVRRYCEFSASENGKIEIGNGVFFNNGCMIVSHEKIMIGDGTRFGPSVKVFDHDYNYKDTTQFRNGKHNTNEILIGKNCWIGAGTIILKGTKLGDGCVVAAGSILKGKYESNQLILQKRKTTVQNYLSEEK